MEQRIGQFGYTTKASIVSLADSYGVSRKTINKWLDRHQAEGSGGLQDRSRAPHRSPQQLSEETIARIIEARQRWGWGPRKLLVKLAQAAPDQKSSGGEHDRGAAARQRTESPAPAPGADAAVRAARRRDQASQPDLVRRLQRLVPHRRWNALRSADDHRRA